MANKVKLVEHDGLCYEVHSVTAKNGKTATVEVPDCGTLEDLADIVAAQIDTEAHICACYKAHNAVEKQAASRRQLDGGKIPQSFFTKTYDSLTDAENKRLADSDSRTALLNKIVAERWSAEQG